ncbi:MAG: hypothetical protein K6C08_06475 [Oscillospiraceae bacterium]|nr:hypothetical protein [Oscillospiraceae bacterium]
MPAQAGASKQSRLDRYRILHGAVCIGDLNPQLLHGLIAFFRWGDQPCQTGLQGVVGLIRVDTVVGHDTHVQCGIMVQREMARRAKGRNRHSGVHLFSGKIKCGDCGGWYGSKV